jgi:molybdopterin-containing oxidoreductase family iron-sulfur binding subunit
MDETRRGFLRAAGFTLLGASCASSLGACARALAGDPDPEALQAKRWAMIVDLPRCLQKEGCRACIDACHRAHNVPALPDPRREVKWLWKEPYEHAFAVEEREAEYGSAALKGKHVLVLCNHCDNPPCVRVCPTGATWRRPDGVVMMDEHRCIGCRYCVVGCPYGSRSFNWQDPRPFVQQVNEEFPTRTRGVVEKCNFCVDRLARGLMPACVEACRQVGPAAIGFGDLGDERSALAGTLRSRFSIRRKPHLGTSPQVFYIV